MSTKFTARVRRGLDEIALNAREHMQRTSYSVSASQQKDIDLAFAWIAEQCGKCDRAAPAASDGPVANWFTKQFGG